MRPANIHPKLHRSKGFSYLALMYLIALISLAAAMTVQLGAITQRRNAEDETIFAGLQYKTAIRSYFEAMQAGSSVAPGRIEDLLRDPRFPGVKRHLRKPFADPLTGKMDWCIIKSTDGKGILGVYPPLRDKPIRTANFPDDVFYFKGQTSYSKWVFVYGVVCTDTGCELDPTQLDPKCDNTDLLRAAQPTDNPSDNP